ncbi:MULTISPECIES: hypothetical protein [unclassified Microcoleus]|uniref:hypothetical protein n=1 Tax=unclassified Microcoleus TaxID=2642155 RepID=UPI002FD2FD40
MLKHRPRQLSKLIVVCFELGISIPGFFIGIGNWASGIGHWALGMERKGRFTDRSILPRINNVDKPATQLKDDIIDI